jgi:hypothetical protein
MLDKMMQGAFNLTIMRKNILYKTETALYPDLSGGGFQEGK